MSFFHMLIKEGPQLGNLPPIPSPVLGSLRSPRLGRQVRPPVPFPFIFRWDPPEMGSGLTTAPPPPSHFKTDQCALDLYNKITALIFQTLA